MICTPLVMSYPMMGSGLGFLDALFEARYLVDMVGGRENVELSTVIKDEARFFILIAGEEDAVAATELKLPAAAKVICN